MRAALERVGVDATQFRALLRVTLKMDFTASPPGARKKRRGAARNIAFYFLVFGLAGVSPAAVSAASPDPLLVGTVLVTFVFFMTLSTLLVDEGTAVLSPRDHHVLGFRPITSRTYFAVRVTSIFARTLLIGTAVALPTTAVLLVKGWGSPVAGAAAVSALLAAYAAGLAVTFVVVALFGWVLRLAGPARLKRWATWTEFLAQTVAWGGFIATTQGVSQEAMAGATFGGNPWWFLYPGTWFGSYVAVGSGALTAANLGAAAASLVLLVVLARAIGGKLSLDYAQDLARLSASASAGGVARPVREGRWMGMLSSETRAVALLVRSHLRHDVKFTLSLVSLLPVLLMYLYLGGFPADPFAGNAFAPGGDGRSNNSMVILMALIFVPSTLRRVLVASSAWRASWVYFVTPADHVRLVLASRNIIAFFFLVPILLVIGALFAWSFGNVLHAMLHTWFIGLISYVVLQWLIMFNPELPFSLPAEKEAEGARRFASVMGSAVVGILLYIILVRVAYRSGTAMLIASALLVGAGVVMDRVTRVRAARRDTLYAG